MVNLKTCGKTLNTEIWRINKHTLEIESYSDHDCSESNKNGMQYYYCTTDYDLPNSIDLCRNCMIAHGLLW